MRGGFPLFSLDLLAAVSGIGPILRSSRPLSRFSCVEDVWLRPLPLWRFFFCLVKRASVAGALAVGLSRSDHRRVLVKGGPVFRVQTFFYGRKEESLWGVLLVFFCFFISCALSILIVLYLIVSFLFIV